MITKTKVEDLMSNLSLNRLYQIRDIRRNYESFEAANGNVAKQAEAEKNKIAGHFVKKANQTKDKIDKHIENICIKKKVLPVGILSFLICAVIVLGAFSFLKPTLSFDVGTVMETYYNAVADNIKRLPSGMRKIYEYAFQTEPRFTITEEKIEQNREEYYEWREGEVYTCLFGNAILFLIIHVILMSIGAAKQPAGLICTPVVVPVLIFDVSMIVFFFIKAIGTAGFLNALLGGLVATIGAIPFIFYAGYTFWLAPLLVVLVSVIFASLCDPACKKLEKHCMKTDPVVLELTKEKNEYLRKSKDNAKAAFDKIMKNAKPNPYSSSYHSISESFLLKGNELYDILWAIENHYAYDVVTARQFLDQRRRDKAIADQLKRNADAAYKQAQAQLEQARATQALANRPVEVKVEVTEYYY